MAHRDHLALDVDASSWFGYVRQAEEPPRKTVTVTFGLPIEVALAPAPDRRLPLRLPFLHLIVQREPRRPPEAAREAEAAAAHAEPLDEDSKRAPSAVRLVRYEDLLPEARLLPALRRVLGARQAQAARLASSGSKALRGCEKIVASEILGAVDTYVPMLNTTTQTNSISCANSISCQNQVIPFPWQGEGEGGG